MSYKEFKHSNGSFRREWRNISYQCHREDGPAIIRYHPDGSINEELFYLNEKYLGKDEKGFWALWDNLTDDKRQNQEILKCLIRFS
jgi:hypothetical protein